MFELRGSRTIIPTSMQRELKCPKCKKPIANCECEKDNDFPPHGEVDVAPEQPATNKQKQQ